MENVKKINIAKLQPNDGQLESIGLPKNPRFIKDDKFRLLCESLRKHPQFLNDRPLIVYDMQDGTFVTLCGNMRLRAATELGWDEVPCIVKPHDTNADDLRALSAIDNSSFGQWDFDLLANEWNADELAEWGVDLPAWDEDADEEQPADLDGDANDKPFVMKITFSDAGTMESFNATYGDMLRDDYKAIVSFSGGGL